MVVKMLTGSKLRRTLSGTSSSTGGLTFLNSHFRAKSNADGSVRSGSSTNSSDITYVLVHMLVT